MVSFFGIVFGSRNNISVMLILFPTTRKFGNAFLMRLDISNCHVYVLIGCLNIEEKGKTHLWGFSLVVRARDVNTLQVRTLLSGRT